MNTNRGSCPQCGAPLPANAPAGLCPRCVMAMNMASETDFGGEGEAERRKKFEQPPTPEALAAKFPQLEILELLGRGGMGAVYKARQKELDRVVALKILPPGIGDDPAFAERFSREAKALAKLNHPGIVTIHDFGRADGLYYFLMEFVDGVNLRQLQGTGRVSPREALAIVPQICDALQYAHDQGIVHRDIKPENILMDRRGRVKVADFGLAKLMGTEPAFGVPPGGGPAVRNSPEGETDEQHLTDAGKVMGTPQYMAPEQKDRPLDVDHRADIYALGVVFYQMLTGELPDREITPPSRKVEIDVRLDEIVLRALEKEPGLRYQQVSEMRTRIGTVASETAGGRSAPGFPDPPRKKRWRDLWLWDTSVIVLVYLVPGLILGIVSVALIPWMGFNALWLLFGEVFFFGHVGLYMWVGHRIGQLRQKLSPPVGEVAEGIVLQGKMQAPGLAVLHADRLELAPIKGEPVTMPLTEIASVRETRWFNGMKLWTKKGFILTLADGRRVGMAIAAPFANRWRAPLSGGKLPEIPADPQERPSNRGASPSSRSRLLMPLVAIVGFLLLGLVIRHYFSDEPLDEPVQDSQSGLSVDSQRIALLSTDWSQTPGVGPSRTGGAPFGPVIERILPDPDNGHPSNEETLQLRTGQMLNVLDGTPGESGGGARLHQLLASEADLTAEYDDHVSGSWVFVTAGLKFSDFPNRQWETATAADLEEALTEPTAMQHVEHFGAVIYVLSETFVPLTLAFEVRDGGRGLLQITGFDHEPRTVAIRYKLLQPDASRDESASAAVIPPTPPVVVRTFPESGASGVDPALTEIRVTFSKAMRDGSWSWVQLDDETFPEMTGAPRYRADGRTCVLPVKLSSGRVYALWLNSDPFANFADSDGLAATPYLLIFETRE